METTGQRYVVYGDKEDEFSIWAIGDIHMMNAGCDRKRLNKDIQTIKDDPFSLWFGLGDMCDFIGVGDRRWDPESISLKVSVQDLGQLGRAGLEMVDDVFSPIADKCMTFGIGNHELSYMNHMEQMHLGKEMANRLDTPYGGYTAFTDIIFIYSPRSKGTPKIVTKSEAPKGEDWFRLRVFSCHGHGYARSQGGKINKLVGFMERFDADLSFIGHLHDQFIKPRIRLRAGPYCEGLIEVPQMGIMTGTYLRTYSPGNIGYGERKAYDPAPLGAVKATVEPYNRGLKGELSIKPSKPDSLNRLDLDVIQEYLPEEEAEKIAEKTGRKN